MAKSSVIKSCDSSPLPGTFKMLQQRENCTHQRSSNFTPHPSLVYLNIGGQDFTTTIDTISSHPPSFLSALVTTKLPTTLDSRGYIFVDRDGSRFRVLLNFLRCGTIHFVNGAVPTATGAVLIEEVLEEARFFGLDNLVSLIEKELNRIELENSLERVFHYKKLLKDRTDIPVKSAIEGKMTAEPNDEVSQKFSVTSPISDNQENSYRIDFDMEF